MAGPGEFDPSQPPTWRGSRNDLVLNGRSPGRVVDKRLKCPFCGAVTWSTDYKQFMSDHDRPEGGVCRRAQQSMKTHTANRRHRSNASQRRNHGDVTQLHAQPYAGGGGFYMKSTEDFERGIAKAKKRGVEEFEIQFINGTKGDAELFAALQLSQLNVPLWFDTIEHLEEYKKATLFAMATNGELHGEDLSDVVEKIDSDVVDAVATEGDLESMSQEWLDDGMLSGEQVAQYFDYEQFGMALQANGDLCSGLDTQEEIDECEARWEGMSDREIGEQWIDEVYGSTEKYWEQIQEGKKAYGRGRQAQEAEDEFKRYFDAEAFARDLDLNGNYREFEFNNKTWTIRTD